MGNNCCSARAEELLNTEGELLLRKNAFNITFELTTGGLFQKRVDALIDFADESFIVNGSYGGIDKSLGMSGLYERHIKYYFNKNQSPNIGKVVSKSSGHRLCKHNIYGIAPIWRGGFEHEERQLTGTIYATLEKANQLNLETIALANFSGEFLNFPATTWWTSLFQAVVLYFKDIETTKITQVQFLGVESPWVTYFEDELELAMDTLGQKNTFGSNGTQYMERATAASIHLRDHILSGFRNSKKGELAPNNILPPDSEDSKDYSIVLEDQFILELDEAECRKASIVKESFYHRYTNIDLDLQKAVEQYHQDKLREATPAIVEETINEADGDECKDDEETKTITHEKKGLNTQAVEAQPETERIESPDTVISQSDQNKKHNTSVSTEQWLEEADSDHCMSKISSIDKGNHENEESKTSFFFNNHTKNNQNFENKTNQDIQDRELLNSRFNAPMLPRLLFSDDRSEELSFDQWEVNQRNTNHKNDEDDLSDMFRIISADSDTKVKTIANTQGFYAHHVCQVVVTQDRKHIFFGTGDPAIKCIDFESKKLEFSIDNIAKRSISGLAISSNKLWLVASSNDNTIKILDLITREVKYSFSDIHRTCPSAVLFCHNQRSIVSAAEDGSIYIIHFLSNRIEKELHRVHKFAINSIALHPKRDLLATGSNDHTIKLIDLTKKEVLHTFAELHRGNINVVIFTPDGKNLLSASSDRSIKVIDLETKQLAHSFDDILKNGIRSMDMSPDSKFLVAGCNESIVIINFKQKAVMCQLKNIHKGSINSLKITSDSKFIVSGSSDSTIKLINLEMKRVVYSFENPHDGVVRSIAFSPDSKSIISASEDKSLKISDVSEHRATYAIPAVHKNNVVSVGISPDGKHIVVACEDLYIKIIDFETKKTISSFVFVQFTRVVLLQISYDSNYLIVSSQDHKFYIVNLESRQVELTLSNNAQKIEKIALCPKSKYVVAAYEGGYVNLTELKSRKIVNSYANIHSSSVSTISISPDSLFIAFGCEQGTLKIVNLDSFTSTKSITKAHSTKIWTSCFSGDSKALVTVSTDQVIKIFDTDMWEVIRTIEIPRGLIRTITISPNAKHLALGSGAAIRVIDI